MTQPIFIIAPSRRCGTTLLQRAINSSREAIIYGENFVFTEILPNIVKDINSNVQRKIENTTYAREKILSGDYDFDASMLFPEFEDYARLMAENLRNVYRFYDQKSKTYGFKTWGIKYQIRRADAFLAFARFFPGARYILVYRNIMEVAKSEKARYPSLYQEANSFEKLAQVWSRNISLMRRIQGDNMLHLEYRDLSPASAETIEKIRQFCELSHMDSKIFQKKLNVSPLLDKLSEEEKSSNYRPPEALTSVEHEALCRHALETCRKQGYDTGP